MTSNQSLTDYYVVVEKKTSMTFLSHIILLILVKNVLFTLAKDNYTVYEITAYNARERAMLYTFHVKDTSIVFLNDVTNEAALPMSVAVLDDSQKDFEDILNMFNIQYHYAYPKSIVKKITDTHTTKKSINNAFLDWDTMRQWIHNKTKNSPYLELEILAKTYEKREVVGLKISTGRGKPIIVVVGAEVGRDWITTAIILNYINDLLTHAQTDKLVEHYDFYFIPVANPDGYVYSFEQDRIWAKNRVQFESGIRCTSGHLPVGLNIDRNWFFFPKLIRQNECLGVFGGHQTISEKETKAMKEILNNCSSNLIAFINLRGFSRLITIPYANAQYVPNNYDLMIEILSAVTDKLRENHNAHYYYGSTARLFYNYTGNCADWVKVKLNVPIVYTIYLQLDEYVFPDPMHIEPLVQQFSAILTNTMAIAGNIYGPLFNTYAKNTSSILIFIAFFVLHVV